VSDLDPWQRVLALVRLEIDEEDFRRWFSSTSYAGDSGEQITVWIGAESLRRHIEVHFQDVIARALGALDRRNAHIRFVVVGFGDEDEDEDAEST
jgi:chromosomal replication initiation ATPase DnaA